MFLKTVLSVIVIVNFQVIYKLSKFNFNNNFNKDKFGNSFAKKKLVNCNFLYKFYSHIVFRGSSDNSSNMSEREAAIAAVAAKTGKRFVLKVVQVNREYLEGDLEESPLKYTPPICCVLIVFPVW